MKKLVRGVGINDADYVVCPRINGKGVWCPYYRKWVSILTRCYSKKLHTEHPAYIGCKVSEEWKTFSNFKVWMETQDWVGKHLDKDILIPDNKLYSRDTCVFVSSEVNIFLTDSNAIRGNYLIGVCWNKQCEKFQAACSDGDGKNVYLGLFDLSWKAYKHKLAYKLADEQSDPRVAEALSSRFAPDSL